MNDDDRLDLKLFAFFLLLFTLRALGVLALPWVVVFLPLFWRLALALVLGLGMLVVLSGAHVVYWIQRKRIR